MHDAQRRAGVGFFRRYRQPDAFAAHALVHLFRVRVGVGIEAERAIEKGFGLCRHAVPVNRRAKYRAVGRQEVLQKQLGVAIARRRRVAFIAQKTAQVIIEKMQAGGSTGFGGARQMACASVALLPSRRGLPTSTTRRLD